MPTTAKLHRSESLGPNLQSRLEALESAMGVRLNLAKRQGRHSLSNTTSPSPMQLSPTTNTTISRHHLPVRSGQGIHRSASSCDVENRPGPTKRLKPSLPNDNSLSPPTSINAIVTIKKYPPSVRRPLILSNLSPNQSSPIKQRLSPMDTSSPRLSRSSTTSNNSSSNSSNYRTPIGGLSPRINSSPRPPLNPASRRQRVSLFGEQFSDDILKINLLWIDLKELDDESRSEVISQFGSIENFLHQQNVFFTKQQQQQSKFYSKYKKIDHRSPFQLLMPKKDRLELL